MTKRFETDVESCEDCPIAIDCPLTRKQFEDLDKSGFPKSCPLPDEESEYPK